MLFCIALMSLLFLHPVAGDVWCGVSGADADSCTLPSHSSLGLLQYQKKLIGQQNSDRSTTSVQQNFAMRHLQSIKCSHEDDSLALTSFNESSLDTALVLGAKFLVNRQKSQGNFHYEYNWKKKDNSDDDNPVRQAGTTWGLAFLHASAPSPEISDAVLKALDFFDKMTVTKKNGIRFVKYPGEKKGSLGTIALLALAHIDFLRSKPQISEDQRVKLTENLNGYIKMLLHTVNTKGHHHHHERVFHGKYHQDTGKPFADDSAYYDGEALLALVRAARHLNRTDLWETISSVAKGTWEANAAEWVNKGDDVSEEGLKRLKGYYQWSSMAMYELLKSGKSGFDPFKEHILQYADWRLATAKYPLDGEQHNIAVTLEGLVPAYLVALHADDTERSDKIGCLLRKSIVHLNSMQVGHPQAAGLAREAPTDDPHANGGVQPSQTSPKLRIDTTQHQMHAVLQIKQLLTSTFPDDPLIF